MITINTDEFGATRIRIDGGARERAKIINKIFTSITKENKFLSFQEFEGVAIFWFGGDILNIASVLKL